MMNNILEAPVINSPWQHCYIDNVLPPELWDAVNEAATLMAPHVKQGSYSIDITESLDFGVPQSTIDMIVEYSDALLEIHKEVLGKFSHTSLTKHGYISDIRWNFSKNRLEPIHDDKANINKMMTFVIYVSPDRDTGTVIYTEPHEHGYHSTVPWTPNSGILFCPEDQVTWHTYQSGNTPRITLNLYYHGLDCWFESPEFRNNAVLKQRLTRIKWIRDMFENGKLYRCYDGDIFEIFKIFDERMKNELENGCETQSMGSHNH